VERNSLVVFQGSTAVLEQRPSAESYAYVVSQRQKLIVEGALTEKDGFFVFTKDTEFSSPSAIGGRRARRKRKRAHRVENEGWKISEGT
jgi:hypothetical protein